MSKKEKIVYSVIIVILVAFIASGITYIVMKDKNSETLEESNNTNNSIVPNDDKVEKDEEEVITLSENELNKYLRYIPGEANCEDYVSGKCNAYVHDETYSSEVEIFYLIGNALGLLSDGADDLSVVGTYGDVYNSMIKMYNMEFDKKSLDDYNMIVHYGPYCYKINDDNFIASYCRSDLEKATFADSYEVNDNNIVIYSYMSYFNSLGGQDEVKDIYTNNVYYVTEKNSEGYIDNDIVVKYMKNNKDKFTKYKHTFRKNEAGYYWYQTEVVKD